MFTDSPLPMLDAERDHRRHAIIEQVIADLKNGPLAHLPSASFPANSAWLVLAAIAFNLTRAVGVLASTSHAKATTATIRRQLNQRRRPRHPLRPPLRAAPTDRLAVGAGLAAALRRRDRPTPHHLTHQRRQARPKDHSGNAGHTGRSTLPRTRTQSLRPQRDPKSCHAVHPGLVVAELFEVSPTFRTPGARRWAMA